MILICQVHLICCGEASPKRMMSSTCIRWIIRILLLPIRTGSQFLLITASWMRSLRFDLEKRPTFETRPQAEAVGGKCHHHPLNHHRLKIDPDLGDGGKESSVVKAKSMKARPSSTINPNWAQLQARLKCGVRKPVVSSLHSSSVLNQTNEKPLLGKRKERPEEQAPLSAAEILTPKNSDCSVTDVVAMDCEMVGVSYQGNKSALGRVTLVNSWGNVIYDEYVHPLERVVDFRSEISGIRPHNLKKAKDFQTVQKDVAALIDDRILVGHALQHDLKALLLSHPKKDTRDTSHYLPLKSKEGKTRALRDLALEHLGVKIQQKQHCPIEDARSALHIYHKYKKEWEKLAKQQWRLRNKQKRKPRNAPKSD